MARTRAKPGPKPKIGPDEQKQVLAVVRVGGSIADAAGVIGVGVRTLRRAMAEDRQFGIGVKQARKSGKVRLIKKVSSAKAWQAAAWMLERQHGSEFGRKERHEVTGKGGGPIKTDNAHTFDYDRYRDLFIQRTRVGGYGGDAVEADRN